MIYHLQKHPAKLTTDIQSTICGLISGDFVAYHFPSITNAKNQGVLCPRCAKVFGGGLGNHPLVQPPAQPADTP